MTCSPSPARVPSASTPASGRVLSALARAALRSTTIGATPTVRNGLPVLPTPAGGRPVTLELVNQLRDELPQ
ncbi:MAG: hypothetical protein WDN30_08310 [Pararobbsia sp.]